MLIDAEESWMQDAADDLVEDMMRKYNKEKVIVFNTLQMYRWDRMDYLKNLARTSKIRRILHRNEIGSWCVYGKRE